MRTRITNSIRIEGAKRKAHKAIVEWFDENPEQYKKAKELSNKRKESLPTVKIMIEVDPTKLIGKKYYCFHKECIISSIQEAEIVLKLKIPTI